MLVCMLVVYYRFYLKMMKEATEKQRLEWMLPFEQDFAWLPHAEKTLEGKDCTSRICILKHESQFYEEFEDAL